MSIDNWAAAIVGACAALSLVVAAFGALVLQVLKNTGDIRAAWARLHEHEKKLNGR